MIVRLADLRSITGFSQRPGLCHPKVREWFDRHGLDWNDFRKHGIDAEILLATGDAFALAVVAQTSAKLEARGGR